jgi:hypothetical protein
LELCHPHNHSERSVPGSSNRAHQSNPSISSTCESEWNTEIYIISVWWLIVTDPENSSRRNDRHKENPSTSLRRVSGQDAMCFNDSQCQNSPDPMIWVEEMLIWLVIRILKIHKSFWEVHQNQIFFLGALCRS